MSSSRCVRPKRRSGLAGHLCWLALIPALWAAVPPSALAEDAIRVELNAAESAQNRCRLSFVIENKGESGIESLKLEIALFGRDGVVQRRIELELGPVRKTKTVVKSFVVDPDCAQIGSILVNNVMACTPGEPGACLDRLELSSRAQSVRFYK